MLIFVGVVRLGILGIALVYSPHLDYKIEIKLAFIGNPSVQFCGFRSTYFGLKNVFLSETRVN